MKERTRRTVDAHDKGVHVDGLTSVRLWANSCSISFVRLR